jgi:hypothetical protein
MVHLSQIGFLTMEGHPRSQVRSLLKTSLVVTPITSVSINQRSPNSLRPGRYESQSAGSRNKAGGAASIHIGIATGSVNKMTGTRNNAAQMQKTAATTKTGINNTNSNKNKISIISLRHLT